MNGLAPLRSLALPFHTAPLLLVGLFSVVRHYPDDPAALRARRLAAELSR